MLGISYALKNVQQHPWLLPNRCEKQLSPSIKTENNITYRANYPRGAKSSMVEKIDL